MSLDSRDFGAFEELAVRAEHAETKDAMLQLVHSPELYPGVPLVYDEMRPQIVNSSFDRTDGTVLVGISADPLGTIIEAVEPDGMQKTDFVSLCRDLNEPLQRKMVVNYNALVRGMAEKYRLLTGVSYISDSSTGRGFAALHIPSYFMHEGYDQVVELNGNDPAIANGSRESVSTYIASSLFDYFSGVFLQEHR